MVPSTVFNVKALGLETALKQAETNRGGIIYFPRGEYHISDLIKIPDNTILRGERKDLVSLYWLDQEKLRRSLVHGKKFAIEDMTLYCQNNFLAVIRVDEGGFKMARVRIRANHMYMLGCAKGETTFHGRQLKMEPRDESTVFHSMEWSLRLIRMRSFSSL